MRWERSWEGQFWGSFRKSRLASLDTVEVNMTEVEASSAALGTYQPCSLLIAFRALRRPGLSSSSPTSWKATGVISHNCSAFPRAFLHHPFSLLASSWNAVAFPSIGGFIAPSIHYSATWLGTYSHPPLQQSRSFAMPALLHSQTVTYIQILPSSHRNTHRGERMSRMPQTWRLFLFPSYCQALAWPATQRP